MKRLFPSIIALLFLSSCGGDEPVLHRPAYNLVLPVVEAAPSLESLAVVALAAEGSVAGVAAECYGEELPEDFIASRERFYAVVNRKFAEHKKGHFVEQRTLLYETAAQLFSSAGNVEGTEAMQALLKRCSAALYIDGQRACDPPAVVRKKYAKAKAAAQGAFEKAAEKF